ncbi:MAG: hypothetical protein ABSH41_23295 [Syntrophobacteraceae bacterium]|jgi:hypothetical protein
MSSIKFTYGMIIHTDGEYRIMYESDCLYVVGHGMCIPVDDSEEAQELLDKLKSK